MMQLQALCVTLKILIGTQIFKTPLPLSYSVSLGLSTAQFLPMRLLKGNQPLSKYQDTAVLDN